MNFEETTYSLQPSSSFGATLSAMWLWLGLWLRGLTRVEYVYDSVPVSTAAPNRARRKLVKHFGKSSVPPVRDLSPFYAFGSRHVSPTQFLERRCRLSCDGRIDVYRIVYYSHRMIREAFMARFESGAFRSPDGLYDVHLGPD